MSDLWTEANVTSGTAKTTWRMALADRYRLHQRLSTAANDNEPKPKRVSRQLAELEIALQRYHASCGYIGPAGDRAVLATPSRRIVSAETRSMSG